MSADVAENGTSEAAEADEETVDKAVVKDLVVQNNRLQDRVEELEAQVETHSKNHLPKTQAQVAMAQLAEAITGREIAKTNDMVQSSRVILNEFQQLHERVQTLEEFADSYGDEKARDRTEAWAQIIQAAQNKQDNPSHTIKGTNEIALYVETLETVTGYSDRHCSNLIDEFADKHGCRKVDYEPASASNNHNATRKQLVVDLDVWGGQTA